MTGRLRTSPGSSRRRRSTVVGLATALAVLAALFASPMPAGARQSTDPLSIEASRFVPLPPTRVLDTRISEPAGAGYVGGGRSMTLQLAGVAGIAVEATAVVLNLTATDSGGAGFVTVWPSGTTRPEVSNLNVTGAGQTRPNLVVAPLGAGGAVDLFASAGAHLVADVSGYFVPVDGQQGGRFVPVDPARLLDTRTRNGVLVPGPVAAGGTIGVRVVGRGGVPVTGVRAVALNVTAVDSAGPGFVTVWPTDQPRPLASNLNTTRAGETVPNAVVVPLGADGTVSVFTQSGTHLVVDVTGWFGDDSLGGTDGLFVPVTPARIADTRIELGIGGLPRDRRIDLGVGGRGGVPAGVASTAVLNLTATEAYGDGFVASHPAATARPTASTLNPSVADTRAGLTFARLGHSDRISLYSSAGTEFVADVTGYFLGTPRPPDPGVPLEPPPPNLALAPVLDAALAPATASGVRVTATVWVEGRGVVYSRAPDTALVPASNQKLFTAVGALSLLPPDHTFATRVSTDAAGNLYLIASGDPTLRRSDLGALAAQVAAAGVTNLSGDLVVDATRYEPARLLPGWENLATRDYGPLSALLVDDNQYRNDTEFRADPDRLNGELFRWLLGATGVTVGGVVRSGSTPAGATMIAEHRSASVDSLVDIMLSGSDNEIAEALVREIDAYNGGPGSTAGGLARIDQVLAGLGVTPGRSTDGSGLSYAAIHSSSALVSLLVGIRGTAIGTEVHDALPVAARTGTLRNRLRDPSTYGNVRAKTGTLRISRALSGYLELADGTDVVFSIVANAPNASASREVIDDWVVALAAA